MSRELKVRELLYSDLPRVLAIERESFRAPWTVGMFVLELSKTSCVRLVVVDGDSVIGYLICSRYDSVWHIMNLAVEPELRRGGVASELIEALLERTELKQARFTLEVRLSNTAATELYRKHGFLPAGVRKSYYQDNGEDALVMWRTQATLEGRLDDIPAAVEVDQE